MVFDKHIHTTLNAKCQHQASKDKIKNTTCIETADRKGETIYLCKKIREVTGKFKSRIGGLNTKTGNDVCEERLVRQGWRDYRRKLYKRDANITTIYIYIYI